MAKSTSWITIEEDKLHTPASGAKKAAKKSSSNQPPVKNKLFWGASFVVLIIVTFGLLAPSQFNELIKGSLFDAIGEDVGSLGIDPLTLLGGADQEEIAELVGEVIEAVPEEVMEAIVEEAVDLLQSETIVQAVEEAVSIAVEPISQPETIDIQPVGPNVDDCGDDIDCFLSHLEDCSLATASYEYQVMGQDLGTDLSLTGEEGNDCLISSVFTKSPLLIGLKGKTADCKLEKGTYTESSLQSKLGDPDEALSHCTGSAIDVIEQFAAFLGSAPKKEEPADTKDEMIAELSDQINQLQNQKDLQDNALQDLTKIVQDQLQNVLPAAPAITLPTGLPPANIPTSITSTTGIGQPGVVPPIFRANPYRVSVSPEQVLAQNKAGGVQYVAQAQYTALAYQPSYTTPNVAQTPETGPEAILIAFLAAFMALIGWKFIRVFA